MIESISTQIERVAIARVEPGQDLLESIETIAERERISSGIILSLVGSLSKANLRNLKVFPQMFPVTDDDRHYEDVDGPLEILNASGNICKGSDNKIHVHAHISVSKAFNGRVVVMGGHLAPGNETFVMVEVFIGVLKEGSFTRTMNSDRKSWEIFFPH